MHSVNLHLYKLSVHKIPFHSEMKFSVCEKYQCVTEQRRQRQPLLLPLPLGCISISIGGSLDFAQLETSGTDRRYNSAIGISYSCTILDKINA